MSCVTKSTEANTSDATARQSRTRSALALVACFFWGEISYNQPLSRVCRLVFEGSTSGPKSVIICVCRFKGEIPLNIRVNNVACQEIMVLAHTRHLLLVTALTRSTTNMPKFRSPPPPTPTPPSSCSTLVSTDDCRGRWRDGGPEQQWWFQRPETAWTGTGSRCFCSSRLALTSLKRNNCSSF